MRDHPDSDRRLQVLSRLATKDGSSEVQPASLCKIATDFTGATGASIMLMSDNLSAGSLCSSDKVSALVENLQFTLGEGPCVDAYNQDAPVLEPDLAEPEIVRWSAFAGPAVDAGVRAIFGFPLHTGNVRLGALNLYCDRARPLNENQHAYALAVADVATHSLLAIQAGALGDSLAPELEIAAESRWVVHQASGMVSAQLDIDVEQALTRLRAYAFANSQLVFDVATLVVNRQLRFNDIQRTES